MDAQAIWQAALGELQLQLTKATFNTWVKDTTLISYEDGTFILGVPSTYAKEWLENRLRSTIVRTLSGLVQRSVEAQFVVRPKPTVAPKPERGGLVGTSAAELSALLPLSAPPPVDANGNGLNLRYTFQSFVVGNSNRLAHAACLAVVETPAGAYNPLFIYGGTGLGKTHLLQAIGHAVRPKNLRPVYVSSEMFTNDLINAIRTQTTEDFRRRYRSADVLLIDDIQFIAGKESTQEEFFHTFNALHSAGRQIVVSSDRSPRAIITLEERLRSRFEGGLIADIQPPDFETRMAILRFKSESQPITVPPEVIDMLARRVQSNIRELMGALTRVVAYAQLMQVSLTLEVASAALQGVLSRPGGVSPEDIIVAVARYLGLEPGELKGHRRNKNVALPRHIAMYLLREETDASLPEIGQLLGGRDHTTVMYGCEKIAQQVEADDALRRTILAIREQLHLTVREGSSMPSDERPRHQPA
jgi:chromosomal replication initiator protein